MADEIEHFGHLAIEGADNGSQAMINAQQVQPGSVPAF